MLCSGVMDVVAILWVSVSHRLLETSKYKFINAVQIFEISIESIVTSVFDSI